MEVSTAAQGQEADYGVEVPSHKLPARTKNHSLEEYNSIQNLCNCGGFVQVSLAKLGLPSQNSLPYVVLNYCWPLRNFMRFARHK